MARTILQNVDYQSIDTSSGNQSLTLEPIIGKQYMVRNFGSGSNTVTVTYGGSTLALTNGSASIFSYDGVNWTVFSKTFEGQDITVASVTLTASSLIESGNSKCVTGDTIHTALQNSLIANTQTISSSGAITLGPSHWEINVDLSGGNINISELPTPDFIGQKVHIYGTGNGMGTVAGGKGVFSNGVYLTSNTGGIYLIAISITEWRVLTALSSAHYDGQFFVLRYTDGNMEMSGNHNKDNGSASAKVFSFITGFTESPRVLLSGRDATPLYVADLGDTPSTGAMSVVVISRSDGAVVSTNKAFSSIVRGVYA